MYGRIQSDGGRETEREREGNEREKEGEKVKYTDNELLKLLGALNLSPLKTYYNSLVEPVASTKLFTHDSPITTHDSRAAINMKMGASKETCR